MSNPGKRMTVAEIAAQVGGTLQGPGDAPVTGVNTLTDATEGDVTFITSQNYAEHWPRSKAVAALVSKGVDVQPAVHHGGPKPLIIVVNAEHAVIRLLEIFQTPEPLPDVGIHPTAAIHPSAKLGQLVRIGPHVSVDRDVLIGDGVTLHAGVRLYPGVAVGAGSTLHANVVVRHNCKIGRAVILHQGVSIGADGFGYRPAPNNAGLIKIPHIGNVIIEDAVEIGANSCVDRGKFGSTIVGAGSKIDNLCQIAHNCRIGRGCVIAGQTGLAGSVTVGDGCQIAGQVGIADNHKIGKGVRIGAQSGVICDIPDGETWLGYPADRGTSVLRQWAAIRKLPDLLRQFARNSS